MKSKKTRIIIISAVVIVIELVVLALVLKHQNSVSPGETTLTVGQTSDTAQIPETSEEPTFETISETLFETVTETTVPPLTKGETEITTYKIMTTQLTTRERTTWDRNKYKTTTERTTAERTTRQKTTRDENAYRASLENCDAEIIKLVNAERKKHGLKPVKASRVVAKAAQIRAKELSVVFAHTRPLTGKSFYSTITEQGYRSPNRAENLAAGQDTAKEVFTAWINCEEHRVNILNPVYKYIGTGCYYNRSTKYQTYWDQLLTDELYKLN